jgi:hypothetical protein
MLNQSNSGDLIKSERDMIGSILRIFLIFFIQNHIILIKKNWNTIILEFAGPTDNLDLKPSIINIVQISSRNVI